MIRKLPFTKMEGIGNDYVYINGFVEQIQDPHDLAKKISDRHFGVGSDGLVLVLPSAVSDLRMRMFNADGTEAEMCGNAARCVGKFAFDHGLIKKDLLRLETLAGEKVIRLAFEGGTPCGATVDMGEPVLVPELVPISLGNRENCIAQALEIDGNMYEITAVSMGNPHAVVFMQNLENLEIASIGPKFENDKVFPRRTNTEFVQVLSRDRIRMRVWERGAGETLACGTGACAAVVGCVLNNLTERQVEVELLGGSLEIKWDEASNHVFMKGPAVTVFDGVFYL
ncbi:MAG: diaminopimelate epimerase [Desulfovibrio sp.]|nr:diaminopimelate epimerase [Desulfovibrio sp.]